MYEQSKQLVKNTVNFFSKKDAKWIPLEISNSIGIKYIIM
jgi:hypothetical protein